MRVASVPPSESRYVSSNMNLMAVIGLLDGLASWYSALGDVQGYRKSLRYPWVSPAARRVLWLPACTAVVMVGSF